MYVIHDYGVWLANGSSTWKEVLSNICGIMYIFGYVFATLTKMRLSTGMQCIRVQHQMPCSRNIRHVMLWYPIILIRVYFSLALHPSSQRACSPEPKKAWRKSARHP
jgi:hypothetical protein